MEEVGAEGIRFGPPPCPLSHHPDPPRWDQPGGGEGRNPESVCIVGKCITIIKNPSASDSPVRFRRMT